MEIKSLIGERIVSKLPNSGTIAFGSGSTVNAVIEQFSKHIQDFSNYQILSGSSLTSQTLRKYNIPETSIQSVNSIDICIDGVDQVISDKPHFMLKGRGGALLREKVLWKQSSKIFIGLTNDKLVNRFTMPIPVEVDPYAQIHVLKTLKNNYSSAKVKIRCNDQNFNFYTDNSNIIIDLLIEDITHDMLLKLNSELKSITGVVDTGLFVQFGDIPITCFIAKNQQIEILEVILRNL
jgi:ribose 5-phosphate isomerase A